MTLLTQSQPINPGGHLGSGGGLGPLSRLWDIDSLGKGFGNVFSAIVGFLTVGAALFFIFQFITAGIQWLSAGGDKNMLQQAQQKLTNSFIGLVIVVAAVAIIKIIGVFLGFDLLNPASFIESIRFK